MMARKIKDGWHTICGHDVYVEDGFIIRGIKQSGQDKLTAWVYRSAGHGWSREDRITPDAFRAGWKRGTIRLF